VAEPDLAGHSIRINDWLRAQAAHDTEVAERAMASKLAKIKPWRGRGDCAAA